MSSPSKVWMTAKKILSSYSADALSPTRTSKRYDTKFLSVRSEDITCDNNLVNVAPDSVTHKSLCEAAQALKSNDVVAFPTETVYGLGANALNDSAVRRIYEAKNRPADNPLIVHIASRKQLEDQILMSSETGLTVPAIYEKLIEKFWPGPLTILLPLPTNPKTISSICTMGQTTVGVRIPSNIFARALISQVGLPLAAPSANASTRPSPTLAQHVYDDLQDKIPYILDGGACDVGLESTVIDGLVSPPLVLRPGGVSIEQIREFGGDGWKDVVYARPDARENEQVRTPGMKYRHYSPRAPVALLQHDRNYTTDLISIGLARFTPKESSLVVGVLTIEGSDLPKVFEGLGNVCVRNYSLGKDPRDMSHELFKQLRAADSEGVDVILIQGVPDDHEGRAIMNRVRKAASVTL